MTRDRETSRKLDIWKLAKLTTNEVPIMRLENTYDYVVYVADRQILGDVIKEEDPQLPNESDSRYMWRLLIHHDIGRSFCSAGLSTYYTNEGNFIDGIYLRLPNDSSFSAMTPEDMFKCFQVLNEGISQLRNTLHGFTHEEEIVHGNTKYTLTDELIKCLNDGTLRVEITDSNSPLLNILVTKKILSPSMEKKRRSTTPSEYYTTIMN